MRSVSIDLFRTVSITIMVVVHFTENLSGMTPFISGFAAPMFLTLAGVSYRLWLNAEQTRNQTESHIMQVSIRRGLFLFFLGFVFNVLVWLPEDTFNWDVLTLIGFGIISLNFVRHVPQPVVAFFCALVVLVSPVARVVAGWSSYWQNGYFDPDMSLADVLQGFLVVGYFPILPWIIYPLNGYLVGTLVFGEDRDSPPGREAAMFGFRIGLGLMLLAGTMLLVRTLFPQHLPTDLPKRWSMYPPSVEYVTMTAGISITLFCAGQLWFDRWLAIPSLKRLHNLVGLFSRNSLTVYVLHHALHIYPLWLYGLAQGQDATEYWRTAMPFNWALGLAGVFLVFCYGFLKWLERTERRGIEGLMRAFAG